MRRLLLVFLSISLLVSAEATKRISNACISDGQAACKPCYRPHFDPDKKVENKWADVTGLELDTTEFQMPLPEGEPPTYPDYSRDLTAAVKTTALDPEGDVLVYSYTVSGGRIVGSGSNVTWDLNRLLPGTYTITAAVDDGCGTCGAKVTRSVTVAKNGSAPACICHKIRIDARHLKARTTERVFEAYLSGPLRSDLTYDWTLSAGEIVSGQGTRTIKVKPSGSPSGQPVNVTVVVNGLDPECKCPNTATRSLTY